MYEQVVNSRISKRFNRYVTAIEMTLTSDEELNAIAFANALKLVERFPNLVTIHRKSPYGRLNRDAQYDFIRNVAMINQKLRHISKGFDVHLMYVMIVKDMIPDYTASLFKHVFSFDDYKEAVSKYPDLDLKFEYINSAVIEVVSSDYDPEKVVKMEIKINSEAVGLIMLTNANRLTHLNISITWKEEFFKLNHLLQAISRLPLQIFILDLQRLVIQGDSMALRWSREDLNALHQVFQIPSLSHRRLNISGEWVDGIQDVLQAYLDSNRDNINLKKKNQFRNIEPTFLSPFAYRIEIVNPEHFPFASFLMEVDWIMELTEETIEKEAIVAKCKAFAEQNPNRSFDLLFVTSDFVNLPFIDMDEIVSDVYKFNVDSKTVQRYDSEYLRENPYR